MHALNHALIVIDVQNDFCPGGSLAVEGGDEILPSVNTMMGDFQSVILTQDWHPANHSSFASNHTGQNPFELIDLAYGPQVLWPNHCIQGTDGAEFHTNLNTNAADLIIRKGFRPEIDSYSAFFENDQTTPTGLHGYLAERAITNLTMVGLATDFCVNFSAVDAARLGYTVAVAQSACRAIDMDGSLVAALDGMKQAGVTLN